MPFKKGQSGNPGGRPKEAAEVKALAQKHGPYAIQRLRELVDDPDGKTSVAACRELLDRGYGRPAQAITGPDGGPLELRVRKAEEMSDDELAAVVASANKV